MFLESLGTIWFKIIQKKKKLNLKSNIWKFKIRLYKEVVTMWWKITIGDRSFNKPDRMRANINKGESCNMIALLWMYNLGSTWWHNKLLSIYCEDIPCGHHIVSQWLHFQSNSQIMFLEGSGEWLKSLDLCMLMAGGSCLMAASWLRCESCDHLGNDLENGDLFLCFSSLCKIYRSFQIILNKYLIHKIK